MVVYYVSRWQLPADTNISAQQSKPAEVVPAAAPRRATGASSMTPPAPQTCIPCQPSQSTTLPRQDAKVKIEITSDASAQEQAKSTVALPVGATTKINPFNPAGQIKVAPPPDDKTRKGPPYDAKAKEAPSSDAKAKAQVCLSFVAILAVAISSLCSFASVFRALYGAEPRFDRTYHLIIISSLHPSILNYEKVQHE